MKIGIVGIAPYKRNGIWPILGKVRKGQPIIKGKQMIPEIS
jgi:hypothetical protein